MTTWTYDARGRLLAEARGDEVTHYAYTPTGLLASVQAPNGYRVDYAYDAAGRLVGASDNRGVLVRYALDPAGHVLRESVEDELGNTARLVTQTFDAVGRAVARQDAAGSTTTFGHDANGATISRTDPLGQATRRRLDSLARPVAITFADNAVATQAWNMLDQPTTLTDPKGVATRYERNAFGEVEVESSPDTGTLSLSRDATGQVAQAQDAKGQLTRVERDALGRPTRIVHADGREAHLAYDASGRLVSQDDASGQARWVRDAQGRTVRKTLAVNDQPARPSRFELSATWEQGELASLAYPSGLQVVYRRQAGRVTGIDIQRPGRRQSPQPWLTGLAYTALGQPRNWRWASGDRAERRFDATGHMASNEFARYGFDGTGRVISIEQDLWASHHEAGRPALFTTPLAWQAGYDARDRLTSFVREGSETRYGHDANSNRLDALERITSDSDLDGQYEDIDYQVATRKALAVAADSNRLLGFTQTVTRTSPGRQPRSVTTPVAYAIDANGAMTSDGLRGFDYDASGRLAAVRVTREGQEVAIGYLHNALGQRVFKGEPQATQAQPSEARLGADFVAWLRRSFGWLFAQAQASTSVGTAYLYGDPDGPLPAWALLGEYDNGSASGRGRSEYIWLPTEDGGALPVGMLRNGRLFAIHPDHLGTPRLVTDEAGQPVWQWPYSAFGDNKPTGVLKATTNPKAALTNQPQLLRATTPIEMNLRMPGQYFDTEVGTFYNLMRDYDPVNGRYRQGDPIGLEGGMNRFVYAGENPLGFIDPLGLTVGVTIWQPTGWGSSSFGHVSTDVDGTTFSFGPNGMTKIPTPQYREKNGFRDGVEITLNLNKRQESSLLSCLSATQRPYSAMSNNCGTPVQECLRNTGIDTGNKLLPVDLGNRLIDLGLTRGAREFPASRLGEGSRAPWAK